MLGSILNVAIALTFVFLLFSLVVSALNEIWLSFFDKRADFLAEGLAELLQDPERTRVNHWNWLQRKKPSPAVAQICSHGLINALARTKTGIPSYIPAEAFVAAILDLIRPADASVDRTLADLRDGIAKIANPQLKQSLTAILDGAKNDLDRFKTGVCAWFDRSMDRVSGWYKRYTQMWLLYLALLLAIGTNVDTAHIVRALSVDPKLREAIVAEATAYTQKHLHDAPAPASTNEPAGNPPPQQESTPSNIETTRDAPAPLLAKFQDTLGALDQLHLPIGWDATQRAYLYDKGPRWAHIVTAIFGWLITALAASMGAPFWFDTLRRFVNVRAAGRAPDEKELPVKKSD